jgi:hypothetical protein
VVVRVLVVPAEVARVLVLEDAAVVAVPNELASHKDAGELLTWNALRVPLISVSTVRPRDAGCRTRPSLTTALPPDRGLLRHGHAKQSSNVNKLHLELSACLVE